MKFPRWQKWQWVMVAVFTLANFFLWYAVAGVDRDGMLTVAFLDVGQGDAIFIDSPAGNQVLVDAGAPSGAVLRALGKVMPFYDRSIDMIVPTHPDADHVGGFPAVLKNYKVAHVLQSEVESETGVFAELKRRIESEDAEVITARRGMRVNLGGGTVLDILFPDRETTGWETNTASIVARLSYGGTSFLLTGDSPVKIEKYLVALNPKVLDVDVLKAGHHGSRTSTSEEYIGWTSPKYAIISAGKNNRYGHPHKEVLDILGRFDVKTISTVERGTIIMKSDGRVLTFK